MTHAARAAACPRSPIACTAACPARRCLQFEGTIGDLDFVSDEATIHTLLTSRLVGGRSRTFLLAASIDFRIGVAELDCDVAFKFVLESDGLHTRQRLDDRRFTVRDMTDRADVDCRLQSHIRQSKRQLAG